ncbi:KRAB domain-containing zinc finger protein [Sarotherodon galilaeus]
MSDTNETEIEVPSAEQAARQVDENSLEQTVQIEQRRSERPRMLTEKGKEFHKERLQGLQRRFDSIYDRWKALIKVAKKSVIKGDPADILEGHMNVVQREAAELNDIYDEYRAMDGPPHDMRSKLDKCTSVTTVEIVLPDAGSIFTSSSSVSVSVHSPFKANTVLSNGSSSKRQEAAAEYEATKAVLQIMTEQEKYRERMQMLEEEDKRISAEQEAAAMSQRLLEEKEETERKLQREKEKAAMIKRQQEESAARRKSVEDLRREIERLENLKGLKAAQAKLQVYEEDYVSVKQERVALNPANLQVTESKNTANQPLQPRRELNVTYESTGELVKVLAEAMSANGLPIPEPSVFSGDPLKFKHWKASFQTLIERKNIPTAEKIFFLQMLVAAAWNMLNESYGEPFVIAKAFRDKLHTWPKVTGKNSAELRKFVDFLQSCQSGMTNNENLNILNDGIENQRLAAKLPDWLSNRWNRKATEYQLEHKRFPRFSYFVTFLSMEASIACNPITSYQAIRQSDFDQPKTKPQPSSIPKRQDTVKIFTTNSTERSMVSCVFCKRAGHGLHKCRKFTEKTVAERVKFIQGEKLCFGCLNSGHLSKNCSNKMTCNTCSKRHPTCLHEERQRQETKKEPPKEQQVSELKETQHQVTQSQDTVNETTSNRVTHESKNTQTSAIVPVYVSTQNEPSKEVLIYALLDTQSDSSFILNEVANNLDTTKTQVKLNLSTMSSKKTTVPCTKLEALQIRGLFSKKKLTVPVVYTRDFIPTNRSHIPTPDTARAWPHLEHLTEHIAPPLDCEIGLLLGYNCTQALMPREVVCGEENQPYAQRTDLGWSIISYCDSCDTSNDVIGVSHRIIVKQVIPETEGQILLCDQD